MMNFSYFKSLRFLLPLLLLVMATVCIAAMTLLRLENAKQNIIDSSAANLKAHISQLQADLSDSIDDPHLVEARQRLLLAALMPNIQTLLLADSEDRVLIASRSIWRHQSVDKVRPLFNAAIADEVRVSGTYRHLITKVDSSVYLLAYHSASLRSLNSGQIWPDQSGILYVEYDLSLPLGKAHEQALSEAASFAWLWVSSIIVFGFCLHFMVIKRIIHLANFARTWQEGHLQTYCSSGHDNEVTQLESAFYAMVEKRKQIELELQQAKETAESASRAKSIFLTQISHEIRNPINSVIGMNSLMSYTNLTDQQRQYANIIDSSAKTLSMLIEDILDMSKIEAQKIDLVDSKFNLRHVIEEIIDIVSYRASKKKLDLTYLIDSDVEIDLVGDSFRLRQILMNLCGNAVKFTEQGSVSLQVEVVSDFEGEVRLRFLVCDTGIGIAEIHKHNLFDAFARVSSPTSSYIEGTGLGLYICKQLAGLMGGEIGFESVLGKGSTFWVSLPFKTSSKPARGAVNLLDGLEVLIAVKNDVALINLRMLLQEQGAICVEVYNVEWAEKWLLDADRSFRLVFVDEHFIGQSLLRCIDAMPGKDNTHFVKLVDLSYSEKGDDVFRHYIYKPVRSKTLSAFLENLFNEPMAERYELNEPKGKGQIEPEPASLRVLVVDDGKANQLLMTKYLQKMGYSAAVADDGSEAIEALRQGTFDLVIMDCTMPVMDGFEATRAIRGGEAGKVNEGIPIIAITAHAFSECRDQCLSAGMDDFLTKPIRPADLTQILDKWLIQGVEQAS